MAANLEGLEKFIKKSLDDVKEKSLRKLGMGHVKYIETLTMFEQLCAIADGLFKDVQSVDEFQKLKHRVIKVDPLAVREISM